MAAAAQAAPNKGVCRWCGADVYREDIAPGVVMWCDEGDHLACDIAPQWGSHEAAA